MFFFLVTMLKWCNLFVFLFFFVRYTVVVEKTNALFEQMWLQVSVIHAVDV